jgi:ribonuclease J
VGETLLIQHGVVFEEESAHVIEAATKAVDLELSDLNRARFTDLAAVQRHITQALGRFWKQEVGRRPVILPVVLED